ncbi:MAG: CbiX/SirB N-terminal domain-containing protein [Gammaproteobacteria bacterium]|nr:CbiX/SirB N-terminal domain-containing protein [Gammaproteobacteria bacterium]MCW8986974.1 CbiX/SirB N-terminal domain-containing protein [Gammaproteobacteria bacterium]MCW9030922.1 CbiX/SirB N-terminal domain-containing protein [Gammaproteobacteria bacterium]
MKALLLVAHGSRRKQSNDEVVILADKLKSNCSDSYEIIHAAFLELAETLIPAGIQKCVDDGAKSIVVLPYFLNSGRHVTEDIPNIVNDTRLHYPDIKIKIAPHLGASHLMMDLLIASSNDTK